VNPDTTTEEVSLLFNVSVPVPLLYVPPVIVPLNPDIEIVPPVLLYKSKVVIAEDRKSVV
jgi:hypothetical protein